MKVKSFLSLSIFGIKTILFKWKRPCYQCIVSENKKRYICGRCIEIDGLCEKCGYLFAVEFSLLCKGNVRVILDMIKTYLKYI